MKLKVSLRCWHAEDLLKDRQSLIDYRRVSRDKLVTCGGRTTIKTTYTKHKQTINTSLAVGDIE